MQGIILMLISAFCARTCLYELNIKQHIHTTKHSSHEIHRKRDREIETERACVCVYEKERARARVRERARERESK